MRNFYLVLSTLLFCGFLQAQIVNIPDMNLKHILTIDNCVDLNDDGIGDADADTNNDGEIQESEAAAVESLILNSATPSMWLVLDVAGLEAFVNLKSFDSGLVSFSEVQNIGGVSQYVGVDVLDLTASPDLEKININEGVLLSSINVSTLSNLTQLRLAFAERPEALSQNLTRLPVNIQGCVNLINLDIVFSDVDIDYCEAPLLETINYLGLFNTVDLDFNCLPNLRTLDIGEEVINSLYLKNGSVLESVSSFSIVGNLLCVDNNQNEFDSLGSLLDNFEYVTTTCEVPLGDNTVAGAIEVLSTSNTGNCGTNNLRSNIKFDFFQNNISVFNLQTSNTSAYDIPIGQGDYQVVPTTNFSDGYTVVPDQFDVSFAGNSGELVVQDICLEPRIEIVDGIEIKFYPFSYASDPSLKRFDAYIDLKNTNAVSYTGELRLVYDDNYSLFIDYDETPDTDENGELIWNTINIGSGSITRIFLRIGYNSEMHPNYPILAGDQLIYDLFLTNSQNSGREVNNDPDFTLIQTFDAGEQTLSIAEFENSIVSSFQINIYPNPSNKLINIENKDDIQNIFVFFNQRSINQ